MNNGEVYQDLETGQDALLLCARSGDANAAKRLMKARADYEYENIREARVMDVIITNEQERR